MTEELLQGWIVTNAASEVLSLHKTEDEANDRSLEIEGETWVLPVMLTKVEETPKPKYDLKAMNYHANAKSFQSQFYWSETPQGLDFWHKQDFYGLTDEGRAALAEMKEQFERENG